MAKKKIQRSVHVWKKPEFQKFDPYSEKEYTHHLWTLDFFCIQEMKPKQLKQEAITSAKAVYSWPKEKISLLRAVNEQELWTPGKYCWAMNNGAHLSAEHMNSVEKILLELIGNVKAGVEEESALPKKRGSSVQDAMWKQIEDIVDQFDIAIDERNFDVDVHRVISGHEYAKPAQCRLIRSYFERELSYLSLEDAKEYQDPSVLPQIKAFCEEIILQCDAVIAENKQKRKPRAKKAQPVEKIVQNVKKLDKFPELGLVSLNPVDCIGAEIVWFYNTKRRKLGFFQTDQFKNEITFKGTSWIGFGVSGEKTVRNTDVLKGIQKLSKAKILRIYKDLTTKEGTPSPRTNVDTVILRKF